MTNSFWRERAAQLKTEWLCGRPEHLLDLQNLRWSAGGELLLFPPALVRPELGMEGNGE